MNTPTHTTVVPDPCPWGCIPTSLVETVPSNNQFPDKERFVVQCDHLQIKGDLYLMARCNDAAQTWNDLMVEARQNYSATPTPLQDDSLVTALRILDDLLRCFNVKGLHLAPSSGGNPVQEKSVTEGRAFLAAYAIPGIISDPR